MKKYKFWSIYKRTKAIYGEPPEGAWFCIPPNKRYIPEWYPKGALVKHHKEEILPPLSYWLQPEYEEIVYANH